MANFKPFSGIVKSISNLLTNDINKLGCNKIISVEGRDESIVNFIVTPSTYFVDHVTVKVGDRVTGFYDLNAPVPLIYPPQLTALVMAKDNNFQSVKVDRFNNRLISSDNQLKLNIAPSTQILLENNQSFNQRLENRNLIVVYSAATKSIPAQTTPEKIIVMCR